MQRREKQLICVPKCVYLKPNFFKKISPIGPLQFDILSPTFWPLLSSSVSSAKPFPWLKLEISIIVLTSELTHTR